MDISNFRCVKEYQTPYPNSIIFRAGEHVSVGEEYDQDPAWKGWIRCRGTGDRVAWIPDEYIQITKAHGILLREYDAKELDLHLDEIVQVSEIVNGFGKAKNRNGDYGWVPMNHLEPVHDQA
jgi:hypothetical protein